MPTLKQYLKNPRIVDKKTAERAGWTKIKAYPTKPKPKPKKKKQTLQEVLKPKETPFTKYLQPVSQAPTTKPKTFLDKIAIFAGDPTTRQKRETAVYLGTAGVLGAVVNPVATGAVAKGIGKAILPKSILGAVGLGVGVPTGIGVLSQSKKARETVKSVVNPLENIKRGKTLGEIIEGKRELPKSVVTGLKVAGVGGAVAGALGAGVIAGKKIKEVFKKTPQKIVDVTKGLSGSNLLSQSAKPDIKPIGAVTPQKEPIPIQEDTKPAKLPAINIKVTPKNYLNNIIQVI